jgi:anti-sigma-K factor RskA
VSRDGFSDLLGPYVMGELTVEEEREVEIHLRECPGCLSELEDIRFAHDLLLQSSTLEPPSELKDWVLARARNEIPSQSARGWQFWVPAAAVLLVAVISGFLVFQAIADNSSGGVELASTSAAPKAGGEVRGEEAGENFRVELEVWGLPELRRGEYYEMWYYREEGGRISCGTFRAQPEGHTTVNLTAPASARSYPEIEITREPGDGDPGTSGKKVLTGSLEDT